jgi:tetraacyldisaccharide 4'-kinase
VIRPPSFWQTDGVIAHILAPFEVVTRIATTRRVARRPAWCAPVPVICCGNASVGGTGKTPVCLDIAGRLRARGIDAHLLTRGYGGGAARGVIRVDSARHTAAVVGDEAMLLAQVAPTWVGADRAATARAAVEAGACALIMDDGLQNPSLAKTCSLLVIDGGFGFGNGRLLPAGPLREPVAAAAERCRAAIIMGPDAMNAASELPPMQVLRARLAPDADMRNLAGRNVVAFAGIGRPEKFFASLREAEINLCARVSFADHHVYQPADLTHLRQQAATFHADLVTTHKDYVRLPSCERRDIAPVGVIVTWNESGALEALLQQAVP